ncbi:MAG: NTP transferase domain-containing protein [Coriobacteriia bacterium]|nr:NTP transferase domain-containing protein [Coriobacteriia bacterium]
MQVVIFNSGLGVRMGDAGKKTHKAMFPLEGHGGETIFERQIRLLSDAGLKDFVITTGPFKDQLEAVLDNPQYSNLNVELVENPVYATTNYIYSLYLARDFITDDVLSIHGDLVFSPGFLQRILSAEDTSCAAVDRQAALPDKDFKARISNGLIKEVAVDIFDSDCVAFQPFYRLRADDMQAWMAEVVRFVDDGKTGVYAENALNRLTDHLQISELSYTDDYVAEVDTLEDLSAVSKEVKLFD